MAAQTQARVALQSRLDVCAVRLAVRREELLGRLRALNGPLNVTVEAILAARAAALLPGAGEAAMAAEEVLLEANEALATLQDAAITTAGATELLASRCAPDPYSRETVACLTWPAPAAAFTRRETLFPDVKGTVEVRRKQGPLARVDCRAGLGPATRLAIQGDANLREAQFSDAYLP